MRRRRVLVKFRAGPAWTDRRPPEAQLDWNAHAAFVDGLTERGTFVMGGPLSDNSGTIVLLEGVTAEQARELLMDDPFVLNGVFELEQVLDWMIYVDELTPAPDTPAAAGRPRGDGRT